MALSERERERERKLEEEREGKREGESAFVTSRGHLASGFSTVLDLIHTYIRKERERENERNMCV